MKTIFLSVLLLAVFVSKGQYYYDDIMDARERSERMRTFIQNSVLTITATGYDPRGARTTDFNEWQEIDKTGKVLKISTRNGQEVQKQYYHFDDQVRLVSITDSSGSIISNTVYAYNNQGKIISIIATTNDQFDDFSNKEEHQWLYNNEGNPEKMWRIVNNADSTEFRFTRDENGNVTDEQLYRRGVGLDPIYYYYNEENLLTDIVRYNDRAKKLLPDFMFEYDDKGHLIQKITILSTVRPDYLIWRYAYDEKGLKTREALFRRQMFDDTRELRGRIEYSYTFGQ